MSRLQLAIFQSAALFLTAKPLGEGRRQDQEGVAHRMSSILKAIISNDKGDQTFRVSGDVVSMQFQRESLHIRSLFST